MECSVPVFIEKQFVRLWAGDEIVTASATVASQFHHSYSLYPGAAMSLLLSHFIGFIIIVRPILIFFTVSYLWPLNGHVYVVRYCNRSKTFCCILNEDIGDCRNCSSCTMDWNCWIAGHRPRGQVFSITHMTAEPESSIATSHSCWQIVSK